jgi:hypothetical protein
MGTNNNAMHVGGWGVKCRYGRHYLVGAWQRGPPLRRRLGRRRRRRRQHEPGAPLRCLGEPRAAQDPGPRAVRGGPGAGVRVARHGRAAELHDLGGGLGGVLALAHELLHLRPGEAHLEAHGRGAAAAGERGGGGRRGGVGGGGERGEVGGGAARELERLEPLAGADVEVARPGAAHGPPRGRAARERDEEVEPAAAERRVGGQRARAGAQELDLLRLEQLEARVVPQHIGRRRRRGLHAEGGAVQLHHLGALALAPDAVPHCGWRTRWWCGGVAAAVPAATCEGRDGVVCVCVRCGAGRGGEGPNFKRGRSQRRGEGGSRR